MTPSLSHDIHVNRMTSQTVLQGPPVALRLLRRFILCLPRGRHLVIRWGAPRFVRQPPFKGRFDSDRQFFVADLGEHIARSLFFYGFYEQVETSALLHVIRPGQTIIDVGANFGYFTLLSAPRVGGSGRVIAFEPEPANAALLRENVALNAHTNITVEEMAVGRAAARVRFRTARPGEWNRGKTATVPAENVGNDGVINVPCVGLDAYCDEHGIRRVDILKMDVEGGEAEAVEGMRRGVQEGRYRRVFLEVHPPQLQQLGREPADILAVFLERGYTAWRLPNRVPGFWRHYSLRFREELLIPCSGAGADGLWPHFLLLAPGVSLTDE